MLKTKFENFEKGDTFHAIGHDVLGMDLAVPDILVTFPKLERSR